MKIKNKKIVNISLIILLIILVILLLLVFFRGTSFSKFKSSVTSNSVSGIAKPVFVVDGDKNIKVDGIKDTIYDFTVKNYNATEVSDVDLKYTIEIVNSSDANLEYELTNNAGERVILTNNKTGVIELNRSSGMGRSSEKYHLKIKYHNNPAITSDIQGNIQVKVEAVQSEVV